MYIASKFKCQFSFNWRFNLIEACAAQSRTLTLYCIQYYFSLGEEDDDNLLDYSNATEGVDPYINKSYTEEETEQHVSPEARLLDISLLRLIPYIVIIFILAEVVVSCSHITDLKPYSNDIWRFLHKKSLNIPNW